MDQEDQGAAPDKVCRELVMVENKRQEIVRKNMRQWAAGVTLYRHQFLSLSLQSDI